MLHAACFMLHLSSSQKFGSVLVIQAPGSGQEKAKRQSIDLQLERCRYTSVDTNTLKTMPNSNASLRAKAKARGRAILYILHILIFTL